jgi:hypothetical protein
MNGRQKLSSKTRQLCVGRPHHIRDSCVRERLTKVVEWNSTIVYRKTWHSVYTELADTKFRLIVNTNVRELTYDTRCRHFLDTNVSTLSTLVFSVYSNEVSEYAKNYCDRLRGGAPSYTWNIRFAYFLVLNFFLSSEARTRSERRVGATRLMAQKTRSGTRTCLLGVTLTLQNILAVFNPNMWPYIIGLLNRQTGVPSLIENVE